MADDQPTVPQDDQDPDLELDHPDELDLDDEAATSDIDLPDAEGGVEP